MLSLHTFQHYNGAWVPGSTNSWTDDPLEVSVQDDFGDADIDRPFLRWTIVGMFPIPIEDYGGYIISEAKKDGIAEEIPGIRHSCECVCSKRERALRFGKKTWNSGAFLWLRTARRFQSPLCQMA